MRKSLKIELGTGMDTNKKTNKNAIYNTIKSVSSIIYPLITFPYISRILLEENVGKINFGNSIISYFSLIASLGVTTYAIRECSKVKDNKEQLEKTASEIYSLNIVSTLISYFVLSVLLIVARPLANYRALICVQSTVILFATLGADWINTTMEDFRYITLRTISMQVISLVLMFAFVRKPEDYIIYAVISVLATSGANLVNIFYRRRYFDLHFVTSMNVGKHLKPIMVLFSISISQIIYTNSDKTILGLIKGDAEVGLYSTSVSIYNIVNSMVASIAWVVIPQLSDAFAKKDYDKINNKVKYALNFIVVLGLPCFCGLEVIARELIIAISGESFAAAAMSLRILGYALLCSFIGGWLGNITMIPAGKEKICLISSTIGASVNIVLNLFLIPIWGLNAAAATTVISELMSVLILAPNFDKNIHIDDKLKILGSPILGSAGIVAIGMVVRNIMVIPWMVTVVTIVVSVIWYVAVLIILKNEFFMSIIQPLFNRFRRMLSNGIE